MYTYKPYDFILTNNMDDMMVITTEAHAYFFICKFMACVNVLICLRHNVTHSILHSAHLKFQLFWILVLILHFYCSLKYLLRQPK